LDEESEMAKSRLGKQPQRKHPFVLEPYESLIRGPVQNIFFPQGVNEYSIARHRAKFVPQIDLEKSYDALSEEDQLYLHIRALNLTRHAVENALEAVSESTWESDIRSDLFGRIRDNLLLRMLVNIYMGFLITLSIRYSKDKTPYQNRYKDPDTSKVTIRKRYLDITSGLATPWDAAVQHQIKQKNGEITCDQNHVEAHPALTKERIFKQLFHRRCGLVVDPRWGAVNLLFPWAIIEAKKASVPLDDAERQLYEGASIYLAMLDDLARDPRDPDKYQEGGAERP
jgi:hypothetical protein